MAKKRILYVSGSIGLGHVTRDLAVAKQLRIQCPEVELSWLAAQPASLLLKEAGQKLLPEADIYANDNIAAENAAKGFGLSLLKYASNTRREWVHNVKIFKQIIRRERFDVVIGDETYEIGIGLAMKLVRLEAPFVMIYDFLGLDSVTKNPIDKLGVYVWNLIWAKTDRKLLSDQKNLALCASTPQKSPPSTRLHFGHTHWTRSVNRHQSRGSTRISFGGWGDPDGAICLQRRPCRRWQAVPARYQVRCRA